MRFQVLGIFLFLSSTAFADEPKAATLSREEFAAGWVSLFDGETTFGWKVDGMSEVKAGILKFGNDRGGQKGSTNATPRVEFGSDWEMEIELLGGTLELDQAVYNFASQPDKDKKWGVVSCRCIKGEYQAPEVSNIRFEKIVVPVIEKRHYPPNFGGINGLPMSIHSIKIRPTKTNDLFNGKDLTGWKRFTGDPKRELSKFEVTKAGELHLTNGSGDLQTEKSYKDFCLQLECKTNGDKLNSGIFFRCLPGQYQQGYEAQIHNGFKDNDRTKPTDFGTGAIYRRIPSRKVVPNDKEWFTLTVLAVGPRLRTWVNGYPTVDWVDERPVNANARSGRKLDAGPISIQGHDPTTDLLFRNIRIAEIDHELKK